MTDPADLLDLPAELKSSGDPVPENPFTKDDMRHEVWKDATREADTELRLFNSNVLKTRPDRIDAGVSWWCALVVGKFDIWAKRSIQVVFDDDDVDTYDQWLFNYAKSWLQTIGDFVPASQPIDFLLRELKLQLISRMEWWKAEARRFVAKQTIHKDRAAGLPDESVRSKPRPTARTWDDIEIIFLSEQRVQINIGAETETRNYAEMGFSSKKNDLPRKAWETLRKLAESNGVLKATSGHSREWPKVEKRIQEIRRIFRHCFRLTGEPIPFKKKPQRNSDDFGYRTKFKIRCGNSYES